MELKGTVLKEGFLHVHGAPGFSERTTALPENLRKKFKEGTELDLIWKDQKIHVVEPKK